MNEKQRLAKNKQIKEAGKATRARRNIMDCRVYHLKISKNKLSKTQANALERIFLEAKWLRNHALARERFDATFLKDIGDTVKVKTPTGLEDRSIEMLGSQMRQGILSQMRGDLASIKALKNKGKTAGKLRFVSEVNSINLQQKGTTYDFDFDNNMVRLQKIGKVKVRGLSQIKNASEYANAKVLKKSSGYYIAVTCYFKTGEKEIPFTPDTEVGIDMGVKTHVTLSTGEKWNSSVREPERLRRLQRRLSRQVKGSNNWRKTKILIAREYEKMGNVKQDQANKLVHSLLGNERIYMQDESLASWKRKNGYISAGKSLHHSPLGLVKAKLASHPRVTILPKTVATTKTCVCGARNDVGLKRTYSCITCGYSEDRDIHAARNMILLSKENHTSGTEGSARGGLNKTSKASASLAKSSEAGNGASL